MKDIIIQSIPHESQPYSTIGNWFRDEDGKLIIQVSNMGNDTYEFLVGLHELIEVMLCEHDGISESSVSRFDVMVESRRKPGDTSEPGDEPTAPYAEQHCFATGIERLMASRLGVKWRIYDLAVESMP